MRNSTKTIVILGVSFLLVAAEAWLKGRVPVSGLLAVVSMACALRVKTAAFVSRRLAEKLGKLWITLETGNLFRLIAGIIPRSPCWHAPFVLSGRSNPRFESGNTDSQIFGSLLERELWMI